MKLTIKHIIPCLVAALSLASCDDWTDVESLDVISPTIENTNPELYAQYLAALRQYKQTEHKVTYAWFDNSVKNTYSRAHHVSDVPDSVDVISLMSPADIMDTEPAEIKDNLIAQLTSSVRWTASVLNMIKDGADDFTECGPGKALQGMIGRIDKTVSAHGIL